MGDGFLRVPDVGRQFEHSIVSRGLRRFFKSVDLDKDGGLTFAELTNFSNEAESQQLQRKAKKLSRRMDKNYDRKVSVEEVCQANKVKLAVNNTEENVKVADVDGDGFFPRMSSCLFSARATTMLKQHSTRSYQPPTRTRMTTSLLQSGQRPGISWMQMRQTNV